jgi:hypothetical protein
MLAALRDPVVVGHATELAEWAKSKLCRFDTKSVEIEPEFVDDWLAPSTRCELSDFRECLGLAADSSPFLFGDRFWSLPLELRFAACLPVLAARELVCYRSTSNRTWPKRGGLAPETGIYAIVLRCIEDWLVFAQCEYKRNANLNTQHGSFLISRVDAEEGIDTGGGQVDVAVTSPPYANRLDYTALWAPELQVASAMWLGDTTAIKSSQIGSTVVKGKQVADDDCLLPQNVRDFLDYVRDDTARASGTYYYPFFRNYVIELMRTLRRLAAVTRPGGKIIVFIRDTVRKDELFRAADFVTSVFTDAGGVHVIDRQRRIVRNHVGKQRRASTSGIYGSAQREWWLAFQKDAG